MFEKASRLKLRFSTALGNATIEDLWDMPLISRKAGASLDDLAKSLNRSIKDGEEESFVTQKSAANTVLSLKFDIVKHVIKVKLEEAEASEKATEIKAKKEKILSIIADKEDEALKGKSATELKELLSGL